MILVDDPALLPKMIKAIRMASGKKLWKVAKDFAATSDRSTAAVFNQFSAWESGAKHPQLNSIGPYLVAHGVRLVVVRDGDGDQTPWCPARRFDPLRSRCAMAVGHGGRHRTYPGVEF